jgi:hypothetical protein
MILNYIAAGFALLMAFAVLFKEKRGTASYSFAAGMVLLALMEILAPIGPFFFAFVPGALLIFSLSFARAEYSRFLKNWKYILAAGFILPPAALLYQEKPGR